MGNLGFKLKKFLQNKNTVTLIGTILILAILYFGYNWRIKQAITPVKIPYAKVTIQPRTKITEDMIDYVDVLPDMVKRSNVLTPLLIKFFIISFLANFLLTNFLKGSDKVLYKLCLNEV